jgi:hypothetical protein
LRVLFAVILHGCELDEVRNPTGSRFVTIAENMADRARGSLRHS